MTQSRREWLSIINYIVKTSEEKTCPEPIDKNGLNTFNDYLISFVIPEFYTKATNFSLAYKKLSNLQSCEQNAELMGH